MPALNQICIVIPALSITAELKKLIGSLNANIIAQVLVVFPDSVSGSQFNEKLGVNTQFIYAKRGRGAQIQAGIDRAPGPYILVLHADSALNSHCLEQIPQILSEEGVALGSFQLKIDSQKWVAKLFSSLARIDSVFTTFGDQGFFFRKEDFIRSCPDLGDYPLMEDIVIRRSLRKIGKVRKSKLEITTSAYRFEKQGFWRTQWLNFVTIIRFLRGECPRKLYAEYYDWVPES